MNRNLWIVLVIWVLSACAFAQGDQPTFKSKAELVLVPTVVTKDGKPVTGLTKDDFVLLHDGNPEQVASFEEIEAVPASIEVVSLPPHTVQNYAKANDHQDVVILLLDFLNGSWSTAARMRSYLSEMTKQLADARTPVTVLLLSEKGLIQVHSFSSAPENLTKAVEQWTSKAPVIRDDNYEVVNWASPISMTSITNSTVALNQFAQRPGYSALMWLDRATMTLHAVEHISEAFRGVPGRKKMIWMSTGFPSSVMMGQAISNTSADALLEMQVSDKGRRAWASLSDANIAVYPLDSNGVVNPTWEEHFGVEHGGERLTALFSKSAPPASLEVKSNTLSMLEVAQKTGGQACTDLPTTCVRKVQADANHYYLLGFYLHGENKPGWHKLKVKVNQPEASARTRDGFMVDGFMKPPTKNADRAKKPTPNESKKATGQEDPRRVAAEKDFVSTVLASPLDYTSLPLRLSWSELPQEGKDRRLELILTSPPNGIPADPASKMDLDYLAFVRPVGKTEGQSFPDTLAMKLSPAQQKDLSINGFRYRKQLSLAPGRYEVRVLLRDNLSQKIGTVSTVVDLSSTTASKQ